MDILSLPETTSRSITGKKFIFEGKNRIPFNSSITRIIIKIFVLLFLSLVALVTFKVINLTVTIYFLLLLSVAIVIILNYYFKSFQFIKELTFLDDRVKIVDEDGEKFFFLDEIIFGRSIPVGKRFYFINYQNNFYAFYTNDELKKYVESLPQFEI